jgi:hypothetical protein
VKPEKTGATISVNGRSAKVSRPQRITISVAIFSALLLASCGAPGEPTAPSPPVPAAISDLTAHQQGSGVQLTFTLPVRTVAGDRLAEHPAIEIFRGSLKPNGAPDERAFKQVYNIPGALAESYSSQGKIQFTDPLPVETLRAQPGASYAYRVRTCASKKRDSADSNTVVTKVFPVPDKIASVEIHVTQSAIELSWPVPTIAASANAGESLSGYAIYRGELDSAAAAPATNELTGAKWKSPPILLASSQANAYSDTLFEFGKTYVYQVRSVVSAGGNSIESDDSAPAIVTPRDTFPPAPPQNVVAAEIPGAGGAITVDLSWSINLESDLAGYRAYRSEQQGERGTLQNSELLLSPAFRDGTVQPAHQYWYTVTAVDRAGNESGPSEAVLADLGKPLP